MSCCYGDNSQALWSVTVRSTPGSKVKPTLGKQSCSIFMSDLSQGLAHTHTHTGLFVRLLLLLNRTFRISFHLTFPNRIYLFIQHTFEYSVPIKKFVSEISLLCSVTSPFAKSTQQCVWMSLTCSQSQMYGQTKACTTTHLKHTLRTSMQRPTTPALPCNHTSIREADWAVTHSLITSQVW